MCGIAGFCLSPNEKINARKVSSCLLKEIASRGKDATGASWVVAPTEKSKRSTIAVSKAPVPASLFDQYLTKMSTNTKRAILHTRWATKGSPDDNLNNHPIVSGKIIGVHNGVLNNDDNIFEYLNEERQAQVDSEAAFALLNLTRHHPADVLRSLQGRAALAWLDAREKRDLHLARCDGSPLTVGSTEKGSLFFASTEDLLLRACDKAGVDILWYEDLEPYTYIRVRNGEIVETREIGESLKQIA